MTETVAAPIGAQSAIERGASSVGVVRSWWGLAVLLGAGLYMFVDRQILALQMEVIRAELSLSDFQIGLVQGLSIAIFAAVLGYPIAWMADRFGRRSILAASILLWAAAVAACGLAANFEQLFVASALVGAGEAGLLPITYAIVADIFRGRSRVVANSVAVTGGRLGSGVLIIASGWLVANIEFVRPILPSFMDGLEAWRLALLATAAIGPIFALLVFTVPPGAQSASMLAQRAANKGPKQQSVWPFLGGHLRGFFSLYAGLGMALFGFSAVGAFLPIAAMRKYGASPEEVGTGMGSVTVLSTIIGMAIAIGGIELVKRRFGTVGALVVLIGSYLICGVSSIGYLVAGSANALWLVFGFQLTFVMIGTMVFPNVIQDMAPTLLRARLIAIVITVNIVMSALSAPFVGLISDWMGQGDNGLMLAMSFTSLVALVMAAGFLTFCARYFGAIVEAAKLYDTKTGTI